MFLIKTPDLFYQHCNPNPITFGSFPHLRVEWWRIWAPLAARLRFYPPCPGKILPRHPENTIICCSSTSRRLKHAFISGEDVPLCWLQVCLHISNECMQTWALRIFSVFYKTITKKWEQGNSFPSRGLDWPFKVVVCACSLSFSLSHLCCTAHSVEVEVK